jgi:hypothetical protein
MNSKHVSKWRVFFSAGLMPNYLNYTHIVLIPKTKSPLSVTEFRPISLCNVLYKLLSKVLANRLKKVLPCIISITKIAFIPGRLILDNILAVYETLHAMHKWLRGKKGYMAMKLDMSKVYDRVKWRFLEAVMIHRFRGEVDSTYNDVCNLGPIFGACKWGIVWSYFTF